MSKWFPSVDTVEGAHAGTRAGAYGALGFAAMNVAGLAYLLITGHAPKEEPGDLTYTAIGMSMETAFIFLCAWRFWKDKGLVIGAITLCLFAIEIGYKVMTGTTNAGWMIFYAAIVIGFVNGLRGAWAFRRFRQVEAG